jgi:hypothetical protein
MLGKRTLEGELVPRLHGMDVLGEDTTWVLLDEEVHARKERIPQHIDPVFAAGQERKTSIQTYCPFSDGIVIGVYGLIAGFPLLSRPFPSATGLMSKALATVKPESVPSGSSKTNLLVL